MSIKDRFKQYPAFEQAFCPAAISIQQTGTTLHPLLSLILGTDKHTESVAHNTDRCLNRILEENSRWAGAKINIILQDHDYSNVSACLGEIRAYGALLNVWNAAIKANSAGSDFDFEVDGNSFIVEVNTPQYTGNEHIIQHGINSTPRGVIRETEVIPFGLPERDKDNVKGEAISKLAAIKAKERQFKTSSVNILWLDFHDPSLWPFGFGLEEFIPVTSYREEISSGIAWNAFYAKVGTNIYDRFSAYGASPVIYQMEYDGRFWKHDSKIDFVLADTSAGKIVYQSLTRSSSIPPTFFHQLFKLDSFRLELCWLDWPYSNQLLDRVGSELKRIQAYQTAFERD